MPGRRRGNRGIIVTSANFVRLGALALVVLSMACEPASAAGKRKRKPDARPQHQSVVREPAAPPRQILPWGVSPLSAEVEATLKPKDSFKECPECPEIVVIPAGSFMMGTPVTEVDRSKGEDPIA